MMARRRRCWDVATAAAATSLLLCNGALALSFPSAFRAGPPCVGTTCTCTTFTCSSRSTTLRMNLLDDIGSILTGGRLEPQQSLPYGQPFCSDTSCADCVRTFAIRERPLSFTGEDFDVSDITDGTDVDFARVRGAMLHLPGKDKMRIRSSRTQEEVTVLDRVLIAATPSYDIYRGGGGGGGGSGTSSEKIGWIEKKFISMTDCFDVYMEGRGGFGVTGLFKPKPAYQISGDFIDRTFVFRNENDQTVAKVVKDGLVQFDSWNHYQLQVAPGMDAMLAIACCCAIDEEFDEEHQERKRRESKED